MPRRVANPKWRTLSRICVTQRCAMVETDTPYHCFCLAPPRGKPKMAYPITHLRYRKLYNNAYIQKKVRLGIPGLPAATRYSRNALEMTARYSRNALEMISSPVFANSEATLT